MAAASFAAASRTAGTASKSYSSCSSTPVQGLRPHRHARRACAARRRHAVVHTQRRCRVVRAAAAVAGGAAWPDAGSDAATTSSSSSSQTQQQRLTEAKRELLSWISGTQRGADTDSRLRGQIEEAQVAVEAFAPEELDYSQLEGCWLLRYTTAVDVTPIVGLDGLPTVAGLPPPLTVGNVYQQFSSVGEGRVFNIIQLSVPFLLEARRGVTFVVDASYDVRSGHRIGITFDGAEVGQLRISEGLEALLAPAVLPRGSLQHKLLLALKEFKVTVPFRSAQQVVRGSAASASYLLTFLDEDLLIGRGPQGTFIFTRSADNPLARDS